MLRYALLVLAVLLAPGGCQPAALKDPYQPRAYVELTHPEWSRNAVIYQINIRQFTPDGSFRAAMAELPRLQALGVDILWLMPVHEIGVKNRKGSLGSPYSVRDYYSVNPEFGSREDLQAFVEETHRLGMHVILDWVANHTAWDNPLTEAHPEWYERDWKGDFHPTPWWDWSDIIDLNYEQQGLRQYMADAMAFWVREAGVDGFRCDVAGYVPLDFWNEVRRELDRIKPVFMLAEAATRDMHYEAFDATYAWGLHSALHEVTRKGASVDALAGHYSEQDNLFPRGSMRMVFTSNHDKNSWEGTEFEMFGEGVGAAIVLTFVGDGIPLVYNGQEAGNTKRLQFFEKDPLVWQDHPHAALFRKLAELKSANSALHNGPWGARMIRTANDSPRQVLSFVRENAENKILALFNFSAEPGRVRLGEALAHDSYQNAFTAEQVVVTADETLAMPPWGYLVLTRQKPTSSNTVVKDQVSP